MQENKKTIFIIEDDVNILYSLQNKFSIHGYKVLTDTGLLAFEAIMNRIRQARPEYLIMDIILPSVDGMDLLSCIKSEEGTCESTVFVYSEFDDKDNKNRSLNCGADHFMSKKELPIDDFVEKTLKIIDNIEKMEHEEEDEEEEDSEEEI